MAASGRYSATLRFERLRGSNGSTTSEDIIRHINEELVEKLNEMQIALRRAIQPSSVQQSVVNTLPNANVIPPSGGAGTVITNNITVAVSFPANFANVSAGASQPVAFFTPMVTADWVMVACYMIIDGSTIDLRDQITVQHTYGFEINIPENGVLIYAVMPKGYTAKALTAVSGAQTLSLGVTMGAADWIVVSCYMILADGTLADLRALVSNQTTTTFDVTTPEAGLVFITFCPRS